MIAATIQMSVTATSSTKLHDYIPVEYTSSCANISLTVIAKTGLRAKIQDASQNGGYVMVGVLVGVNAATVQMSSTAVSETILISKFTGCLKFYSSYTYMFLYSISKGKSPTCNSTEFSCINQKCILKDWVCNGVNDCGDDSDELNCTCPPTEFFCNNRRCIPKARLCDGVNDCGDMSDELNCTASPTCRPFEFSCDNQHCTQKRFVCDGDNDCGDYSDERNCGKLDYLRTILFKFCRLLLLILLYVPLFLFQKHLAIPPSLLATISDASQNLRYAMERMIASTIQMRVFAVR